MNKLILPDSFDWSSNGEPVRTVSLLGVSQRYGVDRDQLKKSASVLTREIADVRPEPGTSVLHVIAMGASDTYGPNRNADGFTRNMLKSAHHTFVTDGHVFKEHRNKDPKQASGTILASAYNDPMDRVELLMRVHDNRWSDEIQKMANFEDVTVSMSCNVPYDVCQVPGCKDPVSKTRFDYCDHMKKYAGQMMDDGVLVYVDNPTGRFFDISGVARQADRIAYGLRKVASTTSVVCGAAMYDQLFSPLIPLARSMKSKRAHWKKLQLTKLAEMEKEIESEISSATPGSPVVSRGGAVEDDHDEDDEKNLDRLSTASKSNMTQVLKALGDARISLSLRDFVRIVMGKDAVSDEDISGAESMLPGLFSKLVDDDDICEDGAYDCADHSFAGIPDWIEDIVGKLVPGMSLGDGPAKTRVMKISIMGPKAASFRQPKLAVTPGASVLAREYAKYKLAFFDKCAADGRDFSMLSAGLGVLQNYV